MKRGALWVLLAVAGTAGCKTPALTLTVAPACTCALPHATSVCPNGPCEVSRCEEGFASCNGLDADGCEVNIATDGKNCGACGNACAGSSVCSSGSCGGVVTLASDPLACGIAVSNGTVFWVRCADPWIPDAAGANGAVKSIAAGGGPVTTLADGQRAIGGIAVDADAVFWTNGPTYGAGGPRSDGQVLGVSRSGGLPYLVGSSFDPGPSLALDPTAVYALAFKSSQSPNGTLLRLDRFDGGATVLTDRLSVAVFPAEGQFLTLHTGALWWLELLTGTVSSLALDGGVTRAVAMGQDNPEALTSDDAAVYWSTVNGQGRTIHAFDGSNSTALFFTTDGQGTAFLALDAQSVYMANMQEGTILQISRATGASFVLAGLQSNPCAIAVDATSVYWTNLGSLATGAGGGVKKVAKQ